MKTDYQLTSFGEMRDNITSFFSELQASVLQSENASLDWLKWASALFALVTIRIHKSWIHTVYFGAAVCFVRSVCIIWILLVENH